MIPKRREASNVPASVTVNEDAEDIIGLDIVVQSVICIGSVEEWPQDKCEAGKNESLWKGNARETKTSRQQQLVLSTEVQESRIGANTKVATGYQR